MNQQLLVQISRELIIDTDKYQGNIKRKDEVGKKRDFQTMDINAIKIMERKTLQYSFLKNWEKK